MKEAPKVSIIVPVYKAEKYLHRCVDSILAQTFTDFELLLVDDGSPDSSGTICDRYAAADPRVHVFHKPNGGVSSARNLGIDNARGEWITFVDADDFISPSYCNIDLSTNCDIIITDYKISEVDNTITDSTPFVGNISDGVIPFLAANLQCNLFRVPWGKFIRRTAIGDIRFTPSQRIGEDTVFMLNLLTATKAISITNDGCYYWQQSDLTLVEKYCLQPKEDIQFTTNILKSYEETGIRAKSFEHFVIMFFFHILDKSKPENVKSWHRNPMISKYRDILCEEGMLTLTFKLWRFYPLFMIYATKIKRILTDNLK